MRQIVLFSYAAILAIMLLFPPTVISARSISIAKGFELQFPAYAESGGFRFIGSIGTLPGNEGQADRTLSMDLRQLGLQVLVVTLIAGACLLAARDRKPSPSPHSAAS